jgi:DNA-binding transcriptional ArsR family regulator
MLAVTGYIERNGPNLIDVYQLLLTFEDTNISKMKRKVRNTILAGLEGKAGEASQLLTAMANAKRLMVLCNLLDGERSVGELAETVGLSSAALSQHLGKMRALRLVRTKRDGQTIYYQLASREARDVLKTLYRLYCGPK